jgi:uncharacterized cupin superfamily protein
MKPVVNLADLDLDRWSQGTRFAGADASLGVGIGLRKLGISYSEVPPGKSACPFHNHHAEEEAFLILEGAGTYRFGPEEFAIRAGDVCAAPAGGPDTAHQIRNTGNATLRYVAISANVATEIVEYPDSGKFLAKTGGPGEAPRFRFVGRREGGEADYWDGEPGA